MATQSVLARGRLKAAAPAAADNAAPPPLSPPSPGSPLAARAPGRRAGAPPHWHMRVVSASNRARERPERHRQGALPSGAPRQGPVLFGHGLHFLRDVCFPQPCPLPKRHRRARGPALRSQARAPREPRAASRPDARARSLDVAGPHVDHRDKLLRGARASDYGQIPAILVKFGPHVDHRLGRLHEPVEADERDHGLVLEVAESVARATAGRGSAVRVARGFRVKSVCVGGA